MANSATKKFQVDIATNPSVLTITAEPVASNAKATVPIALIKSVTPIFYDYATAEANNSGTEFKATYPYATMTRLIFELVDGTKLDWELQNISNQATWNLGTLAALQTAATAINTLL